MFFFLFLFFFSSDKTKQFFWNLKFHVILSTFFSQLTLTLNCYIALVSSWRPLISFVPKWKSYPKHAMTQYIRDRSRKPSTIQVRDEAGTLASPTLTLKHKAVAYFKLPHKWSIIVCSERPSIYWVLHDTSPHRKSFENILKYGNNKNISKTPQFSKTLLYPDHPQVQSKFSIKDDNYTEKLLQTKAWSSVQKYLIAYRTMYELAHWIVKEVNVLVSTRRVPF